RNPHPMIDAQFLAARPPMNTALPEFFQSDFQALTGFTPNNAQSRLMALLLSGRYPRRCGLPTGAGKTLLIVLWLLAFIYHLQNPEKYPRAPRRLVFVVDRRALVDQASDLARALLERLCNPDAYPSHAKRLR